MMGLFFVYIVKSSVCLAGFYLFYRLLLSKETFHRFNRIALLTLLLLSLLLPLVQLTTIEQTEVHQTMLTIEQLLMMADMPVSEVTPAEAVTLSGIQILLMVYLSGVLFFACRHIYSLGRLLMLLRSGEKEKMENGMTLVIHQQKISPFSWMKYIVISKVDLEEDGREILIHEAAHVRNRHSVDLLIADICIFFQWFNPASWLLKQELQNIHEYEADESVIREGVNARQYQLLLIKKAVGTRLYSMANSFNHSKLKKRITMMLKGTKVPEKKVEVLKDTVKKDAPKEEAFEVSRLETVPTHSKVTITDGMKRSGMDLFSVRNAGSQPQPLILVDGKEITGEQMQRDINPDMIESISVLKDEASTAIYGDKAKHGVILITLKGKDVQNVLSLSASDPEDGVKVVGVVKDHLDKPLAGASVFISGTVSGTMSDAYGRFVLLAPKNAMLRISYTGMTTVEKAVAPEVNVTLNPAD